MLMKIQFGRQWGISHHMQYILHPGHGAVLKNMQKKSSSYYTAKGDINQSMKEQLIPVLK